MLLVSRNVNGWIEGCAEARVVNTSGDLDPLGEYVWVEQIYLSPISDGRRVLNDLLLQGLRLMPKTKWGYWLRREKTGNKIHMFSRSQIEKIADKEVSVE